MIGDRSRGILRAILNLLVETDEDEESDGRPHWADDRKTVDYSISVGSLDDALALGSAAGDDQQRRSDAADDREHSPISTRAYGDELLLVADLPDVRAEDVTVEVDTEYRTVTITADGTRVGRVPIGRGDWSVARVSVNNDVLDVLLTRD